MAPRFTRRIWAREKWFPQTLTSASGNLFIPAARAKFSGNSRVKSSSGFDRDAAIGSSRARIEWFFRVQAPAAASDFRTSVLRMQNSIKKKKKNTQAALPG